MLACKLRQTLYAISQLTAIEPEAFTDMRAPKAALKALGLQHGDMVYMHYPFERAVQPSVKRSAFESRPFGALPPPHALFHRSMCALESCDATKHRDACRCRHVNSQGFYLICMQEQG